MKTDPRSAARGYVAYAIATLFALVSLAHADYLVVQYVQGPSPSSATPNTSISLQASCSYVGTSGEQNENQLPGTPQYRWKVEYGSVGTTTSSSPTIGASGWSDWGSSTQFTSTGTLNAAGPISVTVHAEARLVDGNGNPITDAIPGSVTGVVDSAGLFGVDICYNGTWTAAGSEFRCPPSAQLLIRAIRWPLGSSWPAGTPTWTVDSAAAGTGGDLSLTAPSVMYGSKSVSVTDGTLTKSFSVIADSDYAGFGEIICRLDPAYEWQPLSYMNHLIDPNGEMIYKLVKDDTQKPWRTGYPTWRTSFTGQLGSGEQFTIEHRDVPNTWEYVTVRWGPADDQCYSFPFGHYDSYGDLQVLCLPVVAKGLTCGAAASVYSVYSAYFGASTANIGLYEDYLCQTPIDAETAYGGVTVYGATVGQAFISVQTPLEAGDPECPPNMSATKLIHVFDTAPLTLVCYDPISTTFSTTGGDTYDVPAYEGTEVKMYPSFTGLPVTSTYLVRSAASYYAPGSSTPVWLFDRSRADYLCAVATIGDPGKYVFGAYYDSGTNGGARYWIQPIDTITLEAIGVTTLAVNCSTGEYPFAGSLVSDGEPKDLFFAWPSKDGTAVTVNVAATATSSHNRWPSGKPDWTGCDSASGTLGSADGKATSANTASLTAPGSLVIEAECGTERESRIQAVQVDVDAAGVTEANEASSGLTIPLGSTTRVALTVNRAPAALDRGSIRVSCSSTTSAFALYRDATTRYPSTSFPGGNSSVTIPLGSGTTLGDALPGTIYLAPSGSAFWTTLTIEYLNPTGGVVDSDSLVVHTPQE